MSDVSAAVAHSGTQHTAAHNVFGNAQGTSSQKQEYCSSCLQFVLS
jgi:hypothetical protein